MMVQVSKRVSRSPRAAFSQRAASSPRAASARRGAIERAMDVGLFRALGDPTRARLLGCLARCRRACSVGEIALCCSVDLSVVSRHLRVLERAGAVRAEKVGRVVMYEAECASIAGRLSRLAEAFAGCSVISDEACCGGGCCGE